MECAALLRATETGALDAIVPPVAPLDILAQQLVAEVAAAPAGGGRASPGEAAGCTVDELFAMVRRAHPYRIHTAPLVRLSEGRGRHSRMRRPAPCSH